MGSIKKFIKGGREPEPLRYLTVDVHTMTISLARRVWVMRTKETGFFYAFSKKGGTLVAVLGYATWFGSEQDCLAALGRMTVAMAAVMEPVNVYQLVTEAAGIDPVESGEARDDFGDMGLIDPGIV